MYFKFIFWYYLYQVYLVKHKFKVYLFCVLLYFRISDITILAKYWFNVFIVNSDIFKFI